MGYVLRQLVAASRKTTVSQNNKRITKHVVKGAKIDDGYIQNLNIEKILNTNRYNKKCDGGLFTILI